MISGEAFYLIQMMWRENMIITEIARVLDAEILSCMDKTDREVISACSSDMMSDVLAFAKHNSLLLTGRVNQQVIRTAEMKDIICVCFVRGKQPDQAIINLSEEKGIIVMRSEHLMFQASGMLYAAGLVRKGEIDG
jgi:predicted transcriptional regulator